MAKRGLDPENSLFTETKDIVLFASSDDDLTFWQAITESLNIIYTTINTFFTEVIPNFITNVNDYIRNKSDEMGDFFGISSNYLESGTYHANDGRFSRLLKGQTTRIIDALTPKLTSISDAVKRLDDTVLTSLSSNTNRLMTTIDNAFIRYLGVGGFASDGTAHSDDSPLARLIRGQTGRLIDSLDAPLKKYLAVGGFASDASEHRDDSPLAKLIRGQTTRIINGLDTPLKKYLGVGGFGSNASEHADDSPLAKLIRGQTTRIINGLDAPLKNYLGVGGFGSNASEHADDSPLAKLIRGQTTRIVNAIGTITGVTPPEIDDPDYEKMFKPITDLLKDIIKELKNLSVVNEAGTTIWDFLKSLVDGITEVLTGILDFLDNLLDFIEYAFVPQDDFVSDWFNTINTDIKSKFAIVSNLENTITSSFTIEQRDFEDYHIVLPVFGEVKVFDASVINHYLPLFRRMLSAFMILMTMMYAYRKITGNGGVIE